MRPIIIETAGGVIDSLGGTSATAKLVPNRKPQHVSNWRRAGRFPSNTFLVLQRELEARGITAPASLWGMVEPETNNPRGLTPLRQLAGEWR